MKKLIVAALAAAPLLAEQPIPSKVREAFAMWTPPELARFMGQPHDGKIRLIVCTNAEEKTLVRVGWSDELGEQSIERELESRACHTEVLERRPLSQLDVTWRFFVTEPGPAYTYAQWAER